MDFRNKLTQTNLLVNSAFKNRKQVFIFVLCINIVLLNKLAYKGMEISKLNKDRLMDFFDILECITRSRGRVDLP